MKRMHIHVGSNNLEEAKEFYSALFNVGPTVEKPDYLKWELESPSVNFAVSTRAQSGKIDHLGIQTDSDEALGEIKERLLTVTDKGRDQLGATCCYAESNKYWTEDPNGIIWENFHTMETAEVFTKSGCSTGKKSSCC